MNRRSSGSGSDLGSGTTGDDVEQVQVQVRLRRRQGTTRDVPCLPWNDGGRPGVGFRFKFWCRFGSGFGFGIGFGLLFDYGPIPSKAFTATLVTRTLILL